ncbi:27084_t:CDS:1 [Dentiscutata erythropus]|uniref:27084_t:CDS:1 n=1 Tax=Dentiscutata erythropus TaxID=1348616 RepID=A0A9N9K0R0_9GLOM|nr:27084_t:CDS:1 [Dentiscutata erythropus]
MAENKEIILKKDVEIPYYEIYDNIDDESEIVSQEKSVLGGDLITTTAIFNDILFPDNKKRFIRASELQNDISLYTIELVEKKGKLDFQLEKLKEKLDHITNQLNIPKITYVKKEFYENTTLWLPITIEFIADFKIFQRVYHHAKEFWDWKLKPKKGGKIYIIPDKPEVRPTAPEVPNSEIPGPSNIYPQVPDPSNPYKPTTVPNPPENIPIPEKIPIPPGPEKGIFKKIWFKFRWNKKIFAIVVSSLITVIAAVGVDLIISSYNGAERRKEM